MGKPVVSQVGTRQELYWEEDCIYALVSRLKEHSDGRITAEVAFKLNKPDMPTHILHGQFNLLSSRSKRDLVKELEDRYPLPKDRWLSMVEQLCLIAVENHRKGKPALEIWPVAEGEAVPEAESLIAPLLYKGKPTLIFGEGSTGKSYLTLTLGILAQLPLYDNPLGLRPKRANVLYLDYEADEMDFRRRLTLLQRGLNVPPVPILYRECEMPLLEDIDHLEQIVAEHRIGMVIIDSLGVACGNTSLNDAPTATAFYSALRRLNLTCLIITHTSKEVGARKATPFGSVYFTNLARSVFEVRRQQEQEANEIAVALIQTKNNQGPLLSPLGFKITFDPGRTVVKRMEVESIPEFLEKLNLKSRIIHLLKEEKKLPVREIAEVLEKTDGQVRAALNKYKEVFVKVGDYWALKASEDDLH